MSVSLAAAQHALLVAVLFTVVVSVATAALAPRWLASAARLPPVVAARRLRWLLAMPLLAGAALTAVSFLPSLVASIGDLHHHCTSHPGHPHLCLVHAAAGSGEVAGWVVLAVIGSLVLARVAAVLVELGRGLLLVRALPRRAATGGVVTVASDEPLCAAIGLWRPVIVVSSGFAAGVGAEALDVALAHERAHVRRRDGLWSLAARLAGVAHGPQTAARLHLALELATERACDEEAASDVGDRLVVADAILRARRLRSSPGLALAPAFGPAHWSARVDALLHPAAPTPTGLARWDLRAALAAVVVVAAAEPLHHAVETALALLAH